MKDWIDFITRAILINTPEMVHFKIEPMNATKVLTFYTIQYYNEIESRRIGFTGDDE